jgi:hypothetical protein
MVSMLETEDIMRTTWDSRTLGINQRLGPRTGFGTLIIFRDLGKFGHLAAALTVGLIEFR